MTLTWHSVIERKALDGERDCKADKENEKGCNHNNKKMVETRMQLDQEKARLNKEKIEQEEKERKIECEKGSGKSSPGRN